MDKPWATTAILLRCVSACVSNCPGILRQALGHRGSSVLTSLCFPRWSFFMLAGGSMMYARLIVSGHPMTVPLTLLLRLTFARRFASLLHCQPFRPRLPP